MDEQRAGLITDICRQLRSMPRVYELKLGDLEAVFFDEDDNILSRGPIDLMIEYLSEGTHTDGDCNDISGVTQVEVRTL